MFVIKGSENVMPVLWDKVNWETHCENLGYFANFSDNSQIIIIFHSCAEDLHEKSQIQNRINEIKAGFDVSVVHRKGSDDNNEDGSDVNTEEEVVVKRTVTTTEVETRKVVRTSPKAPNQWRAQNNNRSQYSNEWKNYHKF